MKWELYTPFPTKIEHKGRVYKLNLSFGNILRYTDLCDNPNGLNNAEIIDVGFS